MSDMRSKFPNEYSREILNYQESFENVKEKKGPLNNKNMKAPDSPVEAPQVQQLPRESHHRVLLKDNQVFRRPLKCERVIFDKMIVLFHQGVASRCRHMCVRMMMMRRDDGVFVCVVERHRGTEENKMMS